jgi:RNase P/RNase MRP subunit p29
MEKFGESQVKKVVDVLSRAASTLSIRGRLFEETEDAVTVQTATSLFEIPREFIGSMTEVEAAEGAKTVDMSVAREAKIIQKTLVPTDKMVGAVTGRYFEPGFHVGELEPGFSASDCDCACTDCNCDCNCACECKCKCDCTDVSLGIAGVSPTDVGPHFRTPIDRMSRGTRRYW